MVTVKWLSDWWSLKTGNCQSLCCVDVYLYLQMIKQYWTRFPHKYSKLIKRNVLLIPSMYQVLMFNFWDISKKKYLFFIKLGIFKFTFTMENIIIKFILQNIDKVFAVCSESQKLLFHKSLAPTWQYLINPQSSLAVECFKRIFVI